MKQYTTPGQTAKLIELGFEKPKSVISYSYPVQSEEQMAYEASLGLDTYLATVDQIEFEYAYSIGELIEMLPRIVEYKGFYYGLKITTDTTYCWEVRYEPCPYEKGSPKLLPIYTGGSCLIDQLYETLLTLVEMKSEFTDIGGHIEYDGAEELSNVFKLKEK